MSKFIEPEESDSGGGAPAWMVQFADMMSLLLVFFILLLSFSEIDAVKYRALSDSFREAFGSPKVREVFSDSQTTQMVVEATGGRNDAILDELRSIIPQAFPGALPNRYDGQGYLVRIPGRLLFETGKDDLKPDMKPLLDRMAELIQNNPDVTLRIDGHTDNVPIYTTRFRSNWELSAARSLAVVHFLVDECGVPPERVSGAAFADSRPIAPNDSEENKERNRRVEFRFVQGAEEPNYEISLPTDSVATE